MDPMKLIMNKILADPRITSNAIAKDTLNMMNKGDVKGLKELAENMCKEKNVTPDQVKGEIMKMFGF